MAKFNLYRDIKTKIDAFLNDHQYLFDGASDIDTVFEWAMEYTYGFNVCDYSNLDTDTIVKENYLGLIKAFALREVTETEYNQMIGNCQYGDIFVCARDAMIRDYLHQYIYIINRDAIESWLELE